MSWVDIFYLTLVLCGHSGFAMALAYFSQQDLKFGPSANGPSKRQNPRRNR